MLPFSEMGTNKGKRGYTGEFKVEVIHRFFDILLGFHRILRLRKDEKFA